ncbi:MAG: biotin--[acetyl-CoA-carboxylase] ligase [candidate division Zixibacteria bacterium]|nr:biotin--[acetyl-CoA-carboxylase] ligase [candidate division Zixibacteria bacterium]
MTQDLSATAERLLQLLKESRGTFTALGELASRLSADPEAVSRAHFELVKWGYGIDTNMAGEVRLLTVPDLLLPMEIKDGLKTDFLGREIFSFQSLGSTNQVAYRLAEAGAPEGSVIISEEQTSGRGRLSRQWHSPPGLGLWLTFILRPKLALAMVPGLSLLACLACVRTASELTGLAPVIKWPNDSYLHGKKFSGVLTELSAELDKVNFVVIGVGINLNHAVEDFPAELRDKATSLSIESGRKIGRVKFLQNFLAEFENLYSEYNRSGFKNLKPEIMTYFYLLNCQVAVQMGDATVRGQVIDLDREGALVLETAQGIKSVTAGDVTLS